MIPYWSLGVENRRDEAPRAGRAEAPPDPDVVAKPKRCQRQIDWHYRIKEPESRVNVARQQIYGTRSVHIGNLSLYRCLQLIPNELSHRMSLVDLLLPVLLGQHGGCAPVKINDKYIHSCPSHLKKTATATGDLPTPDCKLMIGNIWPSPVFVIPFLHFNILGAAVCRCINRAPHNWGQPMPNLFSP